VGSLVDHRRSAVDAPRAGRKSAAIFSLTFA
jgi:hypothetical protein